MWFRTYVPGSSPMATIKFFFINLVIMYWTFNSIYMQFSQGEQCLCGACACIKGNV